MGKTSRRVSQSQSDRPALILAATLVALLLFLPGAHNLWKAGRVQKELAIQSQKVEKAESAFGKLQELQAQLSQDLILGQLAIELQQERGRWPDLLAALNQICRDEFRDEKQSRMWITNLRLEAPSEEKIDAVTSAPNRPKTHSSPGGPVLVMEGMFETRSKDADAGAVEIFRSALEKTSLFSEVRLLERETPQEVDGKTEQVALKFKVVATWPLRKTTEGSSRQASTPPGS